MPSSNERDVRERAARSCSTARCIEPCGPQSARRGPITDRHNETVFVIAKQPSAHTDALWKSACCQLSPSTGGWPSSTNESAASRKTPLTMRSAE